MSFLTQLSFSTLFGFLIGVALFIYAVISSTDNYYVFISLSSFLLVIGGTLAATMSAYQGQYVLNSVFSMIKIIGPFNLDSKTVFNDVGRMIEFSSVAKRQGPLAIEKMLSASEQNDQLLTYGITLLTSGYNGTDIRRMLMNSIENQFDRQIIKSNILLSMAGFSPAFGMIGTLVGLVIMFEKMGTDIAGIGMGMALALMTTLYGVLMTQLFYKPAAEKIRQREEILLFRNKLIMEGFVYIADGKDSMIIQDHLNSFLDPGLRFDLANGIACNRCHIKNTSKVHINTQTT